MSLRRTIALVAMVAVACLGAIEGVKWFIRARTSAAPSACSNNLRIIHSAEQAWALEHKANSNAVPTWEELDRYLHRPSRSVQCPSGGLYTLGRVDDRPHCSIMWHNLMFGDVAVVDVTGTPLIGVQLVVRRANGIVITSCTTSTNDQVWDGLTYTSMPIPQAHLWSDSATELVAMKEGYHTERSPLPTTFWPVRFTLKKDSK
jgi:hypothetical protein